MATSETRSARRRTFTLPTLLVLVLILAAELERKNVERIALNAGVTPRTLQEFLANYNWDHEAMRNQLQQIVATEHSGRHNIGIIDETSFVKKRDKPPGVQRQHCGVTAVSLRVRQHLLESYPELTVSQVYQATSAIVQSWWLTPTNAERLITATAYRIDYYQRRNAQARRSHTRTRISKLESIGIDDRTMSRCNWEDFS